MSPMVEAVHEEGKKTILTVINYGIDYNYINRFTI